MAQIKIGEGEEPSAYTNHVMVRMTKSGTFQVSGSSNINGIPEHIFSRHFPVMQEAMQAALKWASEDNINDIDLQPKTFLFWQLL